MKNTAVVLAMVSLVNFAGCGMSPEEERISLAKKELDCDNKKEGIVRRVITAVEIQHEKKTAFGGDIPSMPDEEFKVYMQKVLIPVRLEIKGDKKSTQIAFELWKSKHLFEKIESRQVPYYSIPGTKTDNSEQEMAIWKIGRAICLSL